MRSLLTLGPTFVLALGLAAPAVAQTPVRSTTGLRLGAVTAAPADPVSAVRARRTVRVVVVMPAVGMADFVLLDTRGEVARVLPSRLLWAGRNHLALDATGLPAGLYRLKVTTPQGLWHRAVRVG